MTERNIAAVAQDGLPEHTPPTLFALLTLLTLLTRFTRLAQCAMCNAHTLCMKLTTLSYFYCLGHQELENIAYDERGSSMELEQVG